ANTHTLLYSAPTYDFPIINVNWNHDLVNQEKKKDYIKQSIHLSRDIELSIPCNVHGDYFAEQKDNEYTAIGCSEPMRIGQVKTPPYIPIEALEHPKFSVYKSQVMPQMFIVVPKNYVISRKQEDPQKFAPELFLHGVVDIENIPESRCVIDFNLRPDLTYFDRFQMKESLREHTAYEPQITYITEFIGEESFEWDLSNSIIKEANNYTFEDSIHATLETNIRDAQICRSMLENGGISGTYKKKLAEDLEVTAKMTVTLNKILQPWSGEGVRIEKSNNTIQLTNELESPVHVNRLEPTGPEGEVVAVAQDLAPNQQLDLDSVYHENGHIAVFSVQTDRETLSTNYSYIEDIFQQIICFDMFSSDENGNLLEVHVGCQDKPPFTKLDFSDGAKQQESRLLVPISEIIASELFGFYFKYSDADGTVHETNWKAHDFALQGNIITITKNSIT
ncbi:MAG: hypothetical protein WA913_16750, partial [Pricia sp.]